MHRFVRVLLVAALSPLAARAQAPTPVESKVNASIGLGLHYGSPMRGSAALGVLLDLNGNRNDGIIVMAEPGQQGNEISAGYFRMLGKFGSGYSVRAAFVRTKSDPWNASPNSDYVGLEAHWMIVFGVGPRVGYLRRVRGSSADSHDNLASIGVSIGA